MNKLWSVKHLQFCVTYLKLRHRDYRCDEPLCAGAVRAETSISLGVHLQIGHRIKIRSLGSDTEEQMIFDVPVPKITVPVKVGRNIAIIMKWRQ